MHERNEEKVENNIEIEKVDIDEYDTKIDGLKDNLKTLKKLKKREKELIELEKEKNKLMREIRKKHKKR